MSYKTNYRTCPRGRVRRVHLQTSCPVCAALAYSPRLRVSAASLRRSLFRQTNQTNQTKRKTAKHKRFAVSGFLVVRGFGAQNQLVFYAAALVAGNSSVIPFEPASGYVASTMRTSCAGFCSIRRPDARSPRPTMPPASVMASTSAL